MLKQTPEITRKMDDWRNGHGIAPFPQEYNRFHEDLARFDLSKRSIWKVYHVEMVNDGWGDPAEFLQAVIETPNGELHKIKWHESGAWFREGAGWTRYFEMLAETRDYHAAIIRQSDMAEVG